MINKAKMLTYAKQMGYVSFRICLSEVQFFSVVALTGYSCGKNYRIADPNAHEYVVIIF